MSAGCVTNVCPLPPPPFKMMNNEAKARVVGGDDHQTKNPIQSLQGFNSLSSSNHHSIRRTFSADMLALDQINNGFPSSHSLKRTHSSHHLNDDDQKRGAFDDIWSSIQKNAGSGSGSGSGTDLPPPYVHPLVRRSTSLLSQKSLEICTESLGSETGSETGLDGLISYLGSDQSDSDDKEGYQNKHDVVNRQEEEQDQSSYMIINTAVSDDDDHHHDQEVAVANCTVFPSTRIASPPHAVVLTPRSFPPPLPSLANREGSNVHMRSLRRDGRLVVEAVAVPSVNRLRAQRHDGRLLLTLADHHDKPVDDESDAEEDQEEEEAILDESEEEEELILEEGAKEEVNGDYEQNEEVEQEEEDEDEEEEEELAIVMGAKTPSSNMTIKSSTLIMSKVMELTATKNNSAWPRNFNKPIVKTLEDKTTTTLKKSSSSLPPWPVRLIPAPASRAAAATTALNAYEYYWRRGDGGGPVAVLKPLVGGGPKVVQDGNRNKVLLGHNGKSELLGGGGRKREDGEVVVLKPAGEGVVKESEKEEGLNAEEYLVPFFRGCKEPTRKQCLSFWDSRSEPYCIATS